MQLHAAVQSGMNQEAAKPTVECQRFSDACQKLLSGAVHGQQYTAALCAMAGLFDASSIHLLRDIPLHAREVSATAGVQVILQGDAPQAVVRLVPDAQHAHGLLATLPGGQFGGDALLVLRMAMPFTDGERSWMDLMCPHIRAALDIGDQLACPFPTVASAVHMARLFPTPCLLTDEAGRCIDHNEAFLQLLQSMPAEIRAGRVVFGNAFLHASWQQALLEGGLTAHTQTLLATTAKGEQCKVHLVPFACAGAAPGDAPRHLMFAMFDRFARAGCPTRSVPSLHPLTKAELEVLASLLRGHTAKTIARTRGASFNTVRSQIAAILGKTGHHTQKELMAWVTSSAMEGMAPDLDGQVAGWGDLTSKGVPSDHMQRGTPH
jgi:DNA-binding CsgD family transcriptional regulator